MGHMGGKGTAAATADATASPEAGGKGKGKGKSKTAGSGREPRQAGYAVTARACVHARTRCRGIPCPPRLRGRFVAIGFGWDTSLLFNLITATHGCG